MIWSPKRRRRAAVVLRFLDAWKSEAILAALDIKLRERNFHLSRQWLNATERFYTLVSAKTLFSEIERGACVNATNACAMHIRGLFHGDMHADDTISALGHYDRPYLFQPPVAMCPYPRWREPFMSAQTYPMKLRWRLPRR